MSEESADGAVLVTFALPDESREFTAALTRREVSHGHLPVVTGELAGRTVVVVHTGVGDEKSGRQRLQAGLAQAARLSGGQRLRWIISAGYAGGLHPDLRLGDLVLGANHSDPALLAQACAALAGESFHSGTLLTQDVVAETADAKAALHAKTGELAVDMETAWIAAACAEASVPLLSLRVISDAADLSFPVPGHILFNRNRQRPRYLALPLYLLTHPARIAPFAGFVRGLGPARTRLTHALIHLIKGEPPC